MTPTVPKPKLATFGLLIPAHDLRIPHKVYVNRGHGPSVPYHRYHEMSDLSGLPSLLGL